ncbi:hypothetical protein ACFXOD_11730 [Streptomyces sp. NPDC059161]|uniref:hypothetical protein n=1 Tax=Streptomyces sp. NPDC059161 TaxID=3346749 RepID=UPI0036AD4CE1
MTAEEYRRRAERLLTDKRGFGQLQDHQVREADVWARLAISAAISESTQAVRDADQ